jgi:hypothetical protein
VPKRYFLTLGMDYFALKNAGNTNLRGISDDQNSNALEREKNKERIKYNA